MAQSSPIPSTRADPAGIATAFLSRSVMDLSSRKLNFILRLPPGCRRFSDAGTAGQTLNLYRTVRTLDLGHFPVRYCGRSTTWCRIWQSTRELQGREFLRLLWLFLFGALLDSDALSG